MIDKERILFLKSIKKEKRIIIIFQLLIIVNILTIWQLLASNNLINTFITSSPKNIIVTLIKLFNDKILFNNILTTLNEVIISFLLSSIIGFIIATIFWSNKVLEKILDPYLTILNSLPKVALGPLIIIVLGSSKSSIIIMSILISLFVTIINMYNYFINTDKDLIILFKSLKASNIDIFTKLVLPSNRINLITCLKINISMNFIGVIMGELLVSKEGLGYLIMYGSQVFNINLVITSVFILGLLSYLIYIVIDKYEKYLTKKSQN